MVVVKKGKSAVKSIDVKALSAKLGATVKEGRISVVRDKYFVSIGKKKLSIPVGGSIAISDVKKLAGKDVGVVMAGSDIVAIGNPLAHGCYWIICYKPRPDLVTDIGEAVRGATIGQFVRSGAITKEQAQALTEVRGATEMLIG